MAVNVSGFSPMEIMALSTMSYDNLIDYLLCKFYSRFPILHQVITKLYDISREEADKALESAWAEITAKRNQRSKCNGQLTLENLGLSGRIYKVVSSILPAFSWLSYNVRNCFGLYLDYPLSSKVRMINGFKSVIISLGYGLYKAPINNIGLSSNTTISVSGALDNCLVSDSANITITSAPRCVVVISMTGDMLRGAQGSLWVLEEMPKDGDYFISTRPGAVFRYPDSFIRLQDEEK